MRTPRIVLAAAATMTAAVVLAAVLVVPAASQSDVPITTRVKLLEHKVKTLEAQAEAGPRPESARCRRGPDESTLDVFESEHPVAAGRVRMAGNWTTYLLDCGPHGVTRQHAGGPPAGRPLRCYDLDGMSADSTAAVPAAWAAWWTAAEAAGIDDACTTSASMAAAINAGNAMPANESTNHLMLHHTDELLGWETWHATQHHALPAG